MTKRKTVSAVCSNEIMDPEEYAKRTRKEGARQTEVLAWLAMHDFVFWRQNTGCATYQSARKDGSISKRFVRYGVAGLPDILAIEPGTGRLLGIEMKTPVGGLSDQQKDWRARFLDAGAVYLVARSSDELDAWWATREVKP